MSQLIQMRQRIKAVETIKKITHAMRLISMSAHTRLRSKKLNLTEYRKQLSALFEKLCHHVPQWQHPFLHQQIDGIPLVILIGSQKGLCGSFNSTLYNFFNKELKKNPTPHRAIITIGKRAQELITPESGTLLLSFSTFTTTTLPEIVEQLTQHLWEKGSQYSHVTMYANYAKSFFIQRPRTTTILPFTTQKLEQDSFDKPTDCYIWQQDASTILDQLARATLSTTIHDILLESLAAEQAARFIAMDNSTRNARTLLDTMRLEYNKTRQAKITREITDLSSSF